MKDKLLQAFKNKYANLGLDVKILEGLATQFEATTTDETLETTVNGVETLLKSFQGSIDKRVTDAVTRAKVESAVKPASTETNVTKKDENDQPSWLKGLLDSQNALLAKVNALENGKTANNRQSILSEKLKDSNPIIKAKILKDFARMSFENDEAFNEYLTDTETDAAAFIQDKANQGLASGSAPFVATSQASKAIDDDIKAWGQKGVPVTPTK